MQVVHVALYFPPATADYDQVKPGASYDSHTAAFLWVEDLEGIIVDRHRLQ